MYQPPHFREDRLEVQHELIRAFPLGLLITTRPDGPNANLIPFQLCPTPEKGKLQAHVAKANSQWQEIGANPDVLIVFQGVDAYVTPSWYATKRETGKVVPTWNYVTVQVRGTARVIEDRDWLRQQVGALTQQHEIPRAKPWAVDDAPEAFIDAQLKGIVGLEIAITDISGKWKVSQNRSAQDIEGVGKGLAEEERSTNPTMAEMVRKYGQRLPE